jgi:hypothetical protein
MHVAPTPAGGGTELSGLGYSRTEIVNNGTNWSSASAQAKKNATAIACATATGDWASVCGFALYDAATAGNLLIYVPSPSLIYVYSGGSAPVAANGLTIGMDRVTWNDGFKFAPMADAMLDHILGGPDYTPPATLYKMLFTVAPADPTDSGTEVVGGATGYARQPVANNTTSFPGAAAQSTACAVLIDFGTAASAWGTIVWSGWADSLTGGNLLSCGPLGSSRTINLGDPYSEPIGSNVMAEI